jgi:hypothetical protein
LAQLLRRTSLETGNLGTGQARPIIAEETNSEALRTAPIHDHHF